jgi:transcriptional regulator GlxA family with amidase domain
MEDTNHTIDVVAQQTGFGDRNRMRRAFLRAYGQSPQGIRRQSRPIFTKEGKLAEA